MFASCEDQAALQEICGRLGPGQIRVFAERWWARLPLPFTRLWQADLPGSAGEHVERLTPAGSDLLAATRS